MKLLKPIIVAAVSFFILAWAIPSISYRNIVALVIFSAVFALLNKVAKPLMKIFFLPVNIVTLGLFSWVINVAILWLATYLVPGFSIQNMVFLGVSLNQFFSLLVVSFLLSFLQSIVSFIL